MRFKRTLAGLAAGGALVAGALIAGAPADAAGKNGSCESGEFCLYYLQNQGGYVFDLYVSDTDFSNDVFPGTSISANDNTESYRNRDSYYWHVFTNANYGGSHGCLPAGYVGNASATFKNTISSAYLSSSGC
jgi:hypothetical protein